MTWKERRLITVLSVILAILSAALLIVLGIRYRQSRDAVQDPAAQGRSAAQAADSTYASLSVYSGSARCLSPFRRTAPGYGMTTPNFPWTTPPLSP